MSYAAVCSQRNIIYTRPQKSIILIYILILLIIFSSVLYIIQANNMATSGYKIQKYKNELINFETENKNLEIKLSEIQSPFYLETRMTGLNMVKIERVEYLSPVSKVAEK